MESGVKILSQSVKEKKHMEINIHEISIFNYIKMKSFLQ